MTAPTATHPIRVYADWTHRERTRITGILLFAALPKELGTALSAQGTEPQFLITGSTRSDKVTATNDYGDERFHTSGTLDDVTHGAARWLGATAPLELQVQREYATR